MQSDRLSPTVMRRFPRAATISSAILLFLLLAGATVHFWYQQRLLNEQRAALRADMALLANALSAGINRRLSVAEGLEALVRADPEVALSEQMFQAFSAGLAASTNGTRTIALAYDGRISHVFPLEGNRALLGYHLLNDAPPPMRPELERALQEGVPLVQAPVTMPGRTPSLTVQRPIFENGQLWGFVYLAYELQPILQNAGLGGESEQGPLTRDNMALYDQNGALIYGQEALQNQQPLTSPVPFAAGSWQLQAVPGGGWAASIRSSLLLFDAFLLAVILLTTAVAYTVTSRHVNLQEAVRQRTQQISEVNRQLQADIAERQAVEASLRRREAELEEARQLLEQRVRDRTRQLRILLQASHHMTRTLELERVLDLIVEQAHAVVDSPGAAIFIYDEERNQVTLSSHQTIDDLIIPAPYVLQPGSLDYRVIKEGQRLIIDDVLGDSDEAQMWRQRCQALYGKVPQGIRSWMAVPLWAKERAVGMLTCGYPQPDFYSEYQADVAAALANQAAVAIQNARLFRAVQRGAEQFRAISELGRHVTSILDTDELLNQAVRLIQDTFGYYHVHIGLIDNGVVELPAMAGVYEDEKTCQYCASLSLPLNEAAICSQVAASGRPLVVDDIAQEPRYLHPHGATGSGAVVPIKVKGKVIGLLDVEDRRTNAFDKRDVAVLQLLANQLAVAIENARLFKRERWQAEQFRTIADVSRQITAVRALDEVANQAAYLIQQAFGYYHVHIGLIEDDQIIFREATGVWRDERYCTYCNKHKFIVGQTGASGYVAATGEPWLVRDVRRDPYYVPMSEDQLGSALILPLKVHQRTIGVVNIESDTIDGFDDTDVSVLQPLANQLAIALENARLYEQASKLAALQERQKLARELHDSVSQALYGIGLGSRTALKLLETEGTEKEALVAPLEYVLSMANAALAEMRALIFELRPESLATEGLIPALGRRIEVLRARDGLSVEARLEDEPELPLNVKEVLYRVAQEALHNVVKHARASSVRISLQQQGHDVVLEVCDNGVGFQPAAHFPGHLGLQSMRERVEGIGGHFQIETILGGGTSVRAVVGAPDVALFSPPETESRERDVPVG